MTSRARNLLKRPKPGDTVLLYTENDCYSMVVGSKPWPSTVGNPNEARVLAQGISIRDFAVETASKTLAEQQSKRRVELPAQGVHVRDFAVEAEERKAAMAREETRRRQVELRENGVSVKDFATSA